MFPLIGIVAPFSEKSLTIPLINHYSIAVIRLFVE